MAKSAATAASLLGIIAIAAVSLCACEIADRMKYNAMYDDVRAVIEDCNSVDNTAISISGKAVMFDHHESDADYFSHNSSRSSLGELAGTYKDSPSTLFVVATKRLELVGYYQPQSKSGEAYRARYDICVILWPEKKALGMHTILSDPPEQTGYRSYGSGGKLGPVVGDPDDIIQWVKSLPRR